MKNITSIINWDNKYIIISTTKGIYTFDIKINKVINKYLININEEIISIKKINIDKSYPLYLYFVTNKGTIAII